MGSLMESFRAPCELLAGNFPSSFRGYLDVAAQPCQAFKDALAGGCAAGLDFPDVVFGDNIKVQGIGDILRTHC